MRYDSPVLVVVLMIVVLFASYVASHIWPSAFVRKIDYGEDVEKYIIDILKKNNRCTLVSRLNTIKLCAQYSQEKAEAESITKGCYEKLKISEGIKVVWDGQVVEAVKHRKRWKLYSQVPGVEEIEVS